MVNSHLILGEREAVLVDAQFTRSDARRVVSLIRSSGKNLKTIWITHAHPDHYFGLEILLKAFPKAEVFARPSVVKEIQNTAEGKWSYWKPIYQRDLVTDIHSLISKIRSYDDDHIILEGHDLNIVDFKAAESEESAGIYIPFLKSLISGDMVYNRVHLWLADKEGNPASWKRQLSKLPSEFNVEKIYPGHGPNGGLELVASNIRYIEAFEDIMKNMHDRQDAKNRMRSLYPDSKLSVISDLSVDLHFKN